MTSKQQKSKNEEYLFYLQKFLDLLENIQDEDLKKNLTNTMLKCNNALIKLKIEDIENMNKSI